MQPLVSHERTPLWSMRLSKFPVLKLESRLSTIYLGLIPGVFGKAWRRWVITIWSTIVCRLLAMLFGGEIFMFLLQWGQLRGQDVGHGMEETHIKVLNFPLKVITITFESSYHRHKGSVQLQKCLFLPSQGTYHRITFKQAVPWYPPNPKVKMLVLPSFTLLGLIAVLGTATPITPQPGQYQSASLHTAFTLPA